MFDVAPTELLVLGTVALLVIPPKDLPRAMRAAGYWIGKARGAARQFRSGFDNIIREAELQEMEKKWAAENERIMREHPAEPALPQAAGAPEDAENDASDILPPDYVDVSPPSPIIVEQPEIVPALDAPPAAKRSKARS